MGCKVWPIRCFRKMNVVTVQCELFIWSPDNEKPIRRGQTNWEHIDVSKTPRSFFGSCLFAACETASNVTGDSVSGSSSSSASGSASADSATSSASTSTTSAKQMSDAEKLAQVGNTVYFGFDSADLTGNAQSTLDRQAAFLTLTQHL